MHHSNPPKPTAYLGLLLGMMFWGSAFPSSRWAVRHVPPEMAAFLRFGGGTVLLCAAWLVWRPQPTPDRRQVGRAALARLVGVFGYNALFFQAVSLAPASDGSVIFPAMAPVLTVLALVAMRQERASRLRVLGLALGLAGAGLFFAATGAGLPQGSRRLIGDLVFLAGAGVWATYTLLSRRLLAGMDPMAAVTVATCSGSLALGVMAAPHLNEVAWDQLTAGFWANAAWLSVGPTAASYLLYARGIRDVGAGTAATMLFTVPVFGTGFSFLFLGESFDVLQATGALILLAGAYLAATRGEVRVDRPTGGRPPASSDAAVTSADLSSAPAESIALGTSKG